MSDLQWQSIETEEAGDYDVFKVAKLTARSPRTGEALSFHVIRRRHCVQVVASTGDDRFVLVEQFRHGVQHVSTEFPAGTIDDGEDAVQAALRELQEETGYTTSQHEIIGVIEPDTALENTRITIVAAYGCVHSGERALDDGEAIRVRLASAGEINELIGAGKITLAPAIAAWWLWNSRRS